MSNDAEFLRARLQEQKDWLIKAGQYIAASAEWFADVKNAPKSEMRRHYRICETIHDAIRGDLPPGKTYPGEYDAPEVRKRLNDVASRLRVRVGEEVEFDQRAQRSRRVR